MSATGNFDIAVITNNGQQFFRQNFMAKRRVIGPVITVRRLRGINIPLCRVITLFHHLIHQFQSAGNNGATRFLRVEKLMFIDLFRLGMVADVNDLHVLVSSAQEQIQQNIKTFGHIFGGLIH